MLALNWDLLNPSLLIFGVVVLVDQLDMGFSCGKVVSVEFKLPTHIVADRYEGEIPSGRDTTVIAVVCPRGLVVPWLEKSRCEKV